MKSLAKRLWRQGAAQLGLLLLLWPAGAQAQAKATGLRLSTPEEMRGVPMASLPYAGTELPAAVDLSPHMPPPGQQGKLNSCVGWATAYALKSYQERLEEKHPLTDKQGRPDPRRVFSPAFIYNQINNGRDGGSNLLDGLNLLSLYGAASWSDMPYREGDFWSTPSEAVLSRARRFRIDYWRQVNVQDQREVKAHLNAGYPVLIGAKIDEGFMNAGYGHIWNRHEGEWRGGHAMVLVGYNDQRRAFKLINSWGREWSDKGFGWIDYSYFRQAVHEGYVAKDAINGPPPSPAGPVKQEEKSEKDLKTDSIAPAPVDKPDQQPLPDFLITQIRHNLPGPAGALTAYGPGIRIEGRLRVLPGSGQTLQVVVRFYLDRGDGTKGEPVMSLVPDVFALPDGTAATGTPEYPIPADGIQDNWFAYMPYSAFSLPAAGNQRLIAEPTLYIDRFGVRSGAPHTFVKEW